MYPKQTCITQPKEQFIKTAKVVKNPFYDPYLDLSIYTFHLNAAPNLEMKYLYLKIDKNISLSDFHSVIEKNEEIREGREIPFELIEKLEDETSGNFKYLKIWFQESNSNFLDRTFRIFLKGFFPPAATNGIDNVVIIDDGTKFLRFHGGILVVPGYFNDADMCVTKDSRKYLLDERALIKYRISIHNFSNLVKRNVKISQNIYYPLPCVHIEEMGISDAYVNATLNDPGKINVTGSVTQINPREKVHIDVAVKTSKFTLPGTYNFPSIAKIQNKSKTIFQESNLKIEAYSLKADSSFQIESDKNVQYKISIVNLKDSPPMNIRVLSTLYIPAGVEVSFPRLASCTLMNNKGDKVLPGDIIENELLKIHWKRKIQSNSEIELSLNMDIKSIKRNHCQNEYITGILEDIVPLDRDKITIIKEGIDHKSYVKVGSNLSSFE